MSRLSSLVALGLIVLMVLVFAAVCWKLIVDPITPGGDVTPTPRSEQWTVHA